jgi:hypothetical protein
MIEMLTHDTSNGGQGRCDCSNGRQWQMNQLALRGSVQCAVKGPDKGFRVDNMRMGNAAGPKSGPLVWTEAAAVATATYTD